MAAYLGSLAKLPYEIRVMIWEELRPQGHDTVTSSLRVRKVRKSGLAILRTNRDVYDEISRPFYKQTSMVMTFEISPVYEKDAWIVAHCNHRRAVWRLKDETDAVARHLLSFPYDKFGVNVDVLAPNRGDGAHLICLWQKINRFVDFVGRITTTTNIKSVNLRFQNNPATGADWYDHSTKDMIESALKVIRCEHLPAKPTATTNDTYPYSAGDIAFAPFLRLRNVRSFQVTAHCSELQQALNTELIDDVKDVIQQETPVFQRNTNNVFYDDRRIQNIYLHINYILDIALDVMDGHQANMLRLDRYANWFPKGHRGTSKYEHDFLLAMQTCHHLFQIYDDNLMLATIRNKILLVLNPERRKWTTRRRYRHNREGWNPQSWFREFPTGIPAIVLPDFRGILGLNIDEKDLLEDYKHKDEFYLRLRRYMGRILRTTREQQH